MDLTNFTQVLEFIQANGYIVLLIIMIIEGPVTTTAAAFAASFGYFNVLIVLLLSVLGDFIGDLIYFEIGRKAREPLVEKYATKLGIKKIFIKGLEEGLRNHFIKSMTVIKFTPLLSSLGLISTGALRITRKKFIITCLFITIPRAIFFTIVGYYFGVAINPILKYYNLTSYFLLFMIPLIIISYVLYKWLFVKVGLACSKKSRK